MEEDRQIERERERQIELERQREIERERERENERDGRGRMGKNAGNPFYCAGPSG